jgi:hypothetical protein
MRILFETVFETKKLFSAQKGTIRSLFSHVKGKSGELRSRTIVVSDRLKHVVRYFVCGRVWAKVVQAFFRFVPICQSFFGRKSV